MFAIFYHYANCLCSICQWQQWVLCTYTVTKTYIYIYVIYIENYIYIQYFPILYAKSQACCFSIVFCEDLYIFHIYFFWKLVCGSYYEFDLRYAYELYIDLRLNRWICKTEKCQADEAMHEIKVCRLMSNIWHLSSIIYLL